MHISNEVREVLNELKLSANIEFRNLQDSLQTRLTTLLVDGKYLLEVEDDTNESSPDAVRLASYSNSKSFISSHSSIFEGLWNQSEPYEELNIHAKMQEHFFYIAKGALILPLHYIIYMTERVQSQVKDAEQHEHLDIIIRNASRLLKLTEDMLDITRIETKSLVLHKEIFNLNEVILDAISDANKQISKENKDDNLKLELLSPLQEPILIEADKRRISQVVSNLLTNAIHFTNEGSIHVTIDKNRSTNGVIFILKNTNLGIHPDFIPRLFSKIVDPSMKGDMWGFFISKNIIEASGGRIWVEKHAVGKGATFTFSLPVIG